MMQCKPLHEIERDRKRVDIGLFEPLYKLKGVK